MGFAPDAAFVLRNRTWINSFGLTISASFLYMYKKSLRICFPPRNGLQAQKTFSDGGQPLLRALTFSRTYSIRAVM